MTLLIVGTGRVSSLGQLSPPSVLIWSQTRWPYIRRGVSKLNSVAIVAGVPIAAVTAGDLR